MRFEWDENKNKTNIQKHGISFEEACFIFNDPYILSLPDEEHSEVEERWISLGMNTYTKILVVIHTFKKSNVVRVISARKATKAEEKTYFERKET